MHPIGGLLATGDFCSADVSHHLACAFALQDCRSGRWWSPSLDLGSVRPSSEAGPGALRYLAARKEQIRRDLGERLADGRRFLYL